MHHIFGNTAKLRPEIRGHAASLGWDILDDGNLLSTLPDLQSLNRTVREFDGTHLTTAPFTTGLYDNSSYNDSQRADWMGSTMLPQLEWYPVTAGENASQYSYGAYAKLRIQANSRGRTLAAIVQTFGIRTTSWRFPSGDEVDFMSHAALLAGVKGMFFYTFNDYDANSTIDISQPDIWASVVRVSSEIQTLKPFLLDGGCSTEGPGVGAKDDTALAISVWTLGKEKLLAVSNPNKEEKEVLIYQPGPYVGAPQKVFSYRPALSFDGTYFSGQIAGRATTYYRMQIP